MTVKINGIKDSTFTIGKWGGKLILNFEIHISSVTNFNYYKQS